jgi:Uma2 family endonuclease
MSVVTIADAWPEPGQPFAVSDLDRMPDDGHRYELLDGTLIVSPAPGRANQDVANALCEALELARPEELIVFPSVSVRIGTRSVLEPDAVVARPSDVSEARLVVPPLLVAEVLSPDSAVWDLNIKKTAYELFGVRSYWVIDPDPERPSLRAFRLVDGTYHHAGHATGEEAFRAKEPFPVEIVPSRLVATLFKP